MPFPLVFWTEPHVVVPAWQFAVHPIYSGTSKLKKKYTYYISVYNLFNLNINKNSAYLEISEINFIRS